MIVQLAFLWALYSLGVLVGLRLWPGLPTIFTVLTGLLWGVVCWVLLVVFYTILGTGYTLFSMSLPLVVLAGWLIWQIRWQAQDLGWLAGGMLGYLLIWTIPLVVNYTHLTTDSWSMLNSARLLPEGATPFVRQGYPLVTPALHSAGILLDVAYLIPLATAFASSGLLVLGYFIWRSLDGLGRGRIIMPVVSLLFLLSTPIIRFQFVYIHDNMPMAAYMLVVVVSLWLSLAYDTPSWRLPAMLGLVMVGVQRVEGPLMVVLIMGVYVSLAAMSYRDRLRFVILPLIPVMIYHAFTLTLLDQDSFISPANQMIMLAGMGGLVVGVIFSFYQPIERVLLPNGWWLLLVLFAVSLLLAFGLRPDHMLNSTVSLLSNLIIGGWGLFWILLLVTAFFALFLPGFSQERFIISVLALMYGLIVLLAFARTPYRQLWADSGNRMLLHILPVLVWYLAVKYGQALTVSRFVVPAWQRVALIVVSVALVGVLGLQVILQG
jgi:hypothetical protein